MEAISKLGLDIDTQGLVRGAQALDQLNRKTDQAAAGASNLERRQREAGRQMSAMGQMATQLGAQLAAAFSVAAIIRAGDAWISAQNQLRLVTDTAAELRDMTQQVFDISQRTASRFEGMAGLYASIQRAAGSAIGSQREVLRLTQTIAELASASGGPQSSRDAALFQLRQSLGGAVVQAQEFNSLIDGTPLLVQAIADSLGVTRSQLKGMVNDGRLSTQAVIRALQDQADEADALFGRVRFTVGDALIRIQNAFQRLVGTDLGPLFAVTVNGLTNMAEHLDALVPLISGIGVALAIAFAPQAIEAFAGAMGALLGLLAANPFAAIAGALVAAGLALHQFGDQIVVERGRVSDWAKSADQEFRKVGASIDHNLTGQLKSAGDTMKRDVEVTVRDVMDAIGRLMLQAASQFRDKLQQMAADSSRTTKGVKNDFFDMVAELVRALSGGMNRLIAIDHLFLDASDNIWRAIGLQAQIAFEKALNAAKQFVNDASQALSDFSGGAIPAIHLELGDTSELEAQAAALDQRLNAIATRDYTGGFFDRIMQEARGIATARVQATQDQATADQAAAAAAAQRNAANAAALAKERADHKALLADLQAQLDLNEQQYLVYKQTDDLLHQFPHYFADAARSLAGQRATQEQINGLARQLAAAEAQRLVKLQAQIAAQQQLKALAQDEANTRAQIAAASVSADELDVTRQMQDLLRQNAELYASMGKDGAAAARADAQRAVSNQQILDQLQNQAERSRELQRAPLANLISNWNQAYSDFWDTFVRDGSAAFDNLGDAFVNMWRQLQADILRAVFDPIYQAVRQAITQGFGDGKQSAGGLGSLFGGGKSGGGGLGSILSQLGSLFDGKPGNTIGTKGGGLLGSIGDLFKGGKGGGFNIGNISSVLGQVGQAFAFAQIGSGIADALGLVKKEKGGSVGGTVGGLAGFAIGGPIGSAIGSFIGSVIGGLFGPGVTSAATGIRLGAGGNVTRPAWGYGGNDEMTDATRQAANDVASKVSQGEALLKQLGGSLGSFVSELAIAAQREQSGFKLTNSATGVESGFNLTGTIGDPNDLVGDALKAVLGQTTFDNPVIEKVKSALIGTNQSFEDILDTLGKLKEVLPATEAAQSEWQQALKRLNDTFAGLKDATKDSADALAAVTEAQAAAIAALSTEFQKGITDQIAQLDAPIGAAFAQLLKNQAQRLADANAINAAGGSISLDSVGALTAKEIDAFIQQNLLSKLPSAAKQTSVFQQALDALASTMKQLTDAAKDNADALAAVTQAQADAIAALSNQFQKGITDQIAQLDAPIGAAFGALLKNQAQRLKDALAINAAGGSISLDSVGALTAKEIDAFIQQNLLSKLPSAAKQTSVFQQALDSLASTMKQLTDAAKDNADALDKLNNVQHRAIAQIAAAFRGDINSQLNSANDSTSGQFSALLKAQQQRLADAAAIQAQGGLINMANVLKLNAIELKKFVDTAGAGASTFADLQKMFDDFIAKAAAAGQATQPLIDSFNKLAAAMKRDFNSSVKDQIAQLSNPTLYALKQLLDQQKTRLQQAQQLGANVVAVERLNALEIQDFFKNLSDDQKAQLGNYLGLIQDYTGKIAVILTQLNDALSQRIDNMQTMHDQLQQQADTLRDAAKAMAELRQSLADQYGAESPQQNVQNLRGRVYDLSIKAQLGNTDALAQLPQIAQQLISASRALYGSTTTFRGDYDWVQSLLAHFEDTATSRADQLQSQADTLLQQRDLLVDIRNILSSANPQLDQLAELQGELNTGNRVVASLLGQYLAFAGAQAGQNIDLASLYAAAISAAQGGSLLTSNANDNATPPPASGSSPSNTPPPATASADVAAMLAVVIDVLKEGFATNHVDERTIARAIRQLSDSLVA